MTEQRKYEEAQLEWQTPFPNSVSPVRHTSNITEVEIRAGQITSDNFLLPNVDSIAIFGPAEGKCVFTLHCTFDTSKEPLWFNPLDKPLVAHAGKTINPVKLELLRPLFNPQIMWRFHSNHPAEVDSVLRIVYQSPLRTP